jgi:N-methylhydantoinase B
MRPPGVESFANIPRMSAATGAVDALLVSILAKKLESISKEMTRVLARTARSSLLHNGDFSSGLLDGRRRILTQDEGLPLMAYGYTSMLDALVSSFGDDIHPGDVFLHNDPFSGNNQAQDTAVFMPVFHGEELRWWLAAKGHLADWGGARLGGYNPEAVDVWQETIRIPPLKIVAEGRRREDVWRFLLANTRLPVLVAGDINALVAACAIGERGLLELRERYGDERLIALVDELLDRSAERARAEVRTMPVGRYISEARWTLPEGVEPGVVVARLEARVETERITLDYSGTDPQVAHYYNGVYATSYSAAMATLLMLFDPDTSHNEGFERVIDVVIPEGTFLNAAFPAPSVMGNFVANDVVAETVMKAFSACVPERVTAGWGRGLNANFGGRLSDSGESFLGLPLLTNKCGAGGTVGCHGWSAIGLITCGGAFAFDDYEEFEASFPVRLVRHEFWPESAGAGRWRGGFGVDTAYVVEPASLLTTFGDGHDEPFGLFGGKPGKPNRFVVTYPDGSSTVVAPNGSVAMPPGSLVVSHNSGGGGLGDPRERDRDEVALEVRDGLLAADAARALYGWEEP